MEKITLEHLAPYLPYGLNVLDRMDFDSREYNIEYVKNDNTYVLSIGTFNATLSKPYRYPILRPMSDINSAIETENGIYNFKVQLGLVFENGCYCHEIAADYSESPSAFVPIIDFDWWLFKYHFDVFGLIEKGLAISIHDLNSDK